jgi:hypothetical protein
MKLDLGFVRRSEFAGEGFDLWADFAQKVKVQRLAVEQMLDIHQDGRQMAFGQEVVARVERFISVPLDACQQQVVFGGQSTEKRAIDFSAVRFAGREDFTNFQATRCAADDARVPRVNEAIDRIKATDMSQHTNSDEMMRSHGKMALI